MSDAATALKRRDTSAAKAALARRRQRAAHALQPNNTSNAPEMTTSSRIPPIPRKGERSTIKASPIRMHSNADPAGSSKYLSPNRPDSLNAVARNKLSPPGQRQRMSTATTASMTIDSSASTGMTPPTINRTNRADLSMQSHGSSPLRGTPARSPQKVIHYTTQQKEQVVATSSTTQNNSVEEPVATPAGAKRIAPSPINTSSSAVGASLTAPKTSSKELNERLKARYQSPSHAKNTGLPPAAAKTVDPTPAKVPETAKASNPLPPVQPSNPRPPPASTAKSQLGQSSYVRPVAKPPVALNKHVANKPPPTVTNLTINTSAVNTPSNTTNMSRVLAASPSRSAVRDRMTSNNQNSNEAMTPSAANTSSQRMMPTPTNIPVSAPPTTTNTSRVLASSPSKSAVRERMTSSNSNNQSSNEPMTPAAANTSNPKPLPTNIPVNAAASQSNSYNKPQQQSSASPPKTNTRAKMSPQRHELMSQRLAQRALDANRPKTTATAYATQQQQPPRVSPPKAFGSISTFLMNDMSMLDTSSNNLLDTTLPPVDTPINAVTASNEVNESVLLEDVYNRQSMAGWSLDASCLRHHAEIMLQSCSTKKTVQRELPQDDEQVMDDSEVNCRALGLGTPEEALTIDKVDSANPVLRHGNLLRIVAGGSHAMGAYRNERYGLQLLFLPIFSSSPTERQEEQDTLWQVFVAEPETKLLVGRAAVESFQKANHVGAPIRAGVPIVLRHVTSGGVLSMSDHGSLTILTDSFSQSALNYDIQESGMDQLQHHDKLLPSKNQTFRFLPLASPPCPTWAVAGDGETETCIDERVFLTSSYLLHPKRRQAEFQSQMALSLQDRMEMTSKVKEKILIEEVIGSFLGLEGRHIRMKQGDGFHLSGTDGIDFEMSLHHLVEQILPMSTSYIRVQHFVTSHHPGYNHGRVMQAFCEGLDTLVQDYVDFVVQMERQHRSKNNSNSESSLLTMKNIFFQISPWLHSMSILEHATRAVRDTKGGALINSLWSLERQVYMGDMVAKKLLMILLEKASLPYLEMMAEWLESGRLNDPFQEFMVSATNELDATQFDGDDWMAMFGINEENILEGVTSDDWTKEKILTTGKYWNAVHACQVDVDVFMDENPPTIPKLPFNSDSSAIVAYIDSMYQSASRVLVQLMKEKFKLTESMDVIKRYFLLDQGDFVMNFLDAAEDELRKKASEVSVGRVQNWLNASIQLTEQNRRREDETDKRPLVPQALRCRFSAKSLISFLESQYGNLSERMPLTPSRNIYPEATSGSTGIEVFVIDFSYIPFPISLVLSNHAMDKYKLLFRHLLFTKHVERRLINVWRDHQILKKLGALRGLLGPTFLLRQQMLHFVQNFLYYMSFEVIENNWTEMMNSIESNDTKENRQQTVDDILQVHEVFLERTLEACLLTNRDLIRSLTKLLNTVLLFTNQMKRFMDATRIYDDSTILAAEKQLTVQRNLNERGITPGGTKKKTIRVELMSTKREREALNDRQTRRVGREVVSESYQRMVARFREVFNADVADFMRELNTHTASGLVANLGVRLDYNGFVTSSIR